MLRRTHRFHGYNSLNHVYRHGATVRATDMSLRYVLNQKRSTYRVAVVVGKKVHKSAVVRNRIRRRVFEQLRLALDTLDKPYDIVVTIHAERIAEMPSDQLEPAIQQLLTQAKLLEK